MGELLPHSFLLATCEDPVLANCLLHHLERTLPPIRGCGKSITLYIKVFSCYDMNFMGKKYV